MNQSIVKSTSTDTLAAVAAQIGGVDPDHLQNVLLKTCFQVRGRDGNIAPSNEQFAALIAVCHAHKLNPLTREIYALIAKNGQVVPVVSVDGWMRIMNENPQFNGIQFKEHFSGNNIHAITCTIHRKDRQYPTEVTEYMSECERNTDPWKKYPVRMLRHKAAIQTARMAFSFAGIYEQDEGERIIEGIETVIESPPATDEEPKVPQTTEEMRDGLPQYTQEQFDTNFPSWKKLVNDGKVDVNYIISTLTSKYTLQDNHREQVMRLETPNEDS